MWRGRFAVTDPWKEKGKGNGGESSSGLRASDMRLVEDLVRLSLINMGALTSFGTFIDESEGTFADTLAARVGLETRPTTTTTGGGRDGEPTSAPTPTPISASASAPLREKRVILRACSSDMSRLVVRVGRAEIHSRLSPERLAGTLRGGVLEMQYWSLLGDELAHVVLTHLATLHKHLEGDPLKLTLDVGTIASLIHGKMVVALDDPTSARAVARSTGVSHMGLGAGSSAASTDRTTHTHTHTQSRSSSTPGRAGGGGSRNGFMALSPPAFTLEHDLSLAAFPDWPKSAGPDIPV